MGVRNADDVLAHYGVMGMKWGVRKNKQQAGLSRTRQALIEQNNNQMKLLKDARAGKNYKLSVKIGKKILGSDGWEKNYQTTVKSLKAQNKRLVQKGKLSTQDKLAVFNRVSLLDLVVSQKYVPVDKR